MSELNEQQRDMVRQAVKFMQLAADNLRWVDHSQAYVGSEAFQVFDLSIVVLKKYGLHSAMQAETESEAGDE